MTTPSDSAILQAVRELKGRLSYGREQPTSYTEIMQRARAIDVAHPAAADAWPACPECSATNYPPPMGVSQPAADSQPESSFIARWTQAIKSDSGQQTAAAGELPEAVAWKFRYCNMQDMVWLDKPPTGNIAFSDVKPLFTADQFRAAVAGYRRDAVDELVAAAKGATEERIHDGVSSKKACDRLVAALANLGSGDGKEG